jgi:hypothetical protein
VPLGPPSKTQVVTLWAADFAIAITMGHWSRLVDSIVSFVLNAPFGPVAWRSETSLVWQPVGTSTLVRIVQAATVPSSPAKWTELQDGDGKILHIDNLASEVRFQFDAEVALHALGQSKKRKSGVWSNNSGQRIRDIRRVPIG